MGEAFVRVTACAQGFASVGVLLVAVGPALVSGAWNEFVNGPRATAGPGQIGI